MLEMDLPTLPPAADFKRDIQMVGCRSSEKERWGPGLNGGNAVAETVRGLEYEGDDTV